VRQFAHGSADSVLWGGKVMRADSNGVHRSSLGRRRNHYGGRGAHIAASAAIGKVIRFRRPSPKVDKHLSNLWRPGR